MHSSIDRNGPVHEKRAWARAKRDTRRSGRINSTNMSELLNDALTNLRKTHGAYENRTTASKIFTFVKFYESLSPRDARTALKHVLDERIHSKRGAEGVWRGNNVQ
jgi:hypothetical protein